MELRHLAMMGLETIVIVARHGERLDYVERDSGNNWIAQNSRPWDPPLSPIGMKQAEELGRHVSKTLADRKLPAISTILSSPFLRCRQTAVGALKGITSEEKSSLGGQKVQVEYGLAESLNENWYRSWALPGSDGTWGFSHLPSKEQQERQQSRRPIDDYTAQELHTASQKPVQTLLDWKETLSTTSDSDEHKFLDLDHVSRTQIKQPYSLIPLHLETRKEQKERMAEVLDVFRQKGQTVFMVSHGGPVTHLYEKLTGNSWKVHGESTYCCYSIYKYHETEGHWEALVVNESSYLKDLWSQGTSNI